MSNSKFIVIAAPSGSGKTTIVNKLLKEKNLNLSFSVSATSADKNLFKATNPKSGKVNSVITSIVDTALNLLYP